MRRRLARASRARQVAVLVLPEKKKNPKQVVGIHLWPKTFPEFHIIGAISIFAVFSC